jgi:hypothetical protein
VEPGAVRCRVRVADPVAPVTPRQVVGIVVHLQLGQRHLPTPNTNALDGVGLFFSLEGVKNNSLILKYFREMGG